MGNFIVNNNQVRVVSDGEIIIKNSLPVGVYSIELEPISKEVYLEKKKDFNNSVKIYGDIEKKVDKVINTFNDRNKNMGVLLSGEKGAGKTFFAKVVSQKLMTQGISTIVINNRVPHNALSKILENISEKVCVFFDEFDKIYYDYERDSDEQSVQDSLLSILDGTTISKVLFLFTCNEKYKINNFFLDRPSRIFYHFKFNGLSESMVKDYCEENLKNKKYVDEIINVSSLSSYWTFDILQCLVDELNRYDLPVLETLEDLNISNVSEIRQKFDTDFNFDDAEKSKLYLRGLPVYDRIFENDFYVQYLTKHNDDIGFHLSKDNFVKREKDRFMFRDEERGITVYLKKIQDVDGYSWRAF